MSWVIFDTNIYVNLIKEYKETFDEVAEKLSKDQILRICGLNLIENEIKTSLRGENKIFKDPLIKTYEALIEKEYKADKKCQELGDAYFKEYKRLRKKRKNTKKLKNIKTDLLIYACATIKGLDIVYSGDRETLNKTSFAPEFIVAYRNINAQIGARNPDIKTFDELKEYIKKNYNL